MKAMHLPTSQQLHIKTTKKDAPGKKVDQRLEQCEHELTILKDVIQGQFRTNKQPYQLSKEH